MINSAIDDIYDDRVFFYSCQIEFNVMNGWVINVNPSACLASINQIDPEFDLVADLRSGPMRISQTDNRTRFGGKILFSAGVLLVIEDQILLFRRDAAAPTEPCKWTSPAGRCDREPLLTALKEFHEEVILYDSKSGRPIYVDIANNPYLSEIEQVYKRALKRKGFNPQTESWIRMFADTKSMKLNNTYPVTTRFGEEVVDSSLQRTAEYFSFMDNQNSTLELLLPLSLNSEKMKDVQISFCDGEYQREVRLFSKSEFYTLSPEILVSTMINLKDNF